MSTRAGSARPGLRWMEGVLGTLRQAGCSPALAHHFYHALDAHTTGFALWQANFPFDDQAELEERGPGVHAARSARPTPISSSTSTSICRPTTEEPSEFEFGLELILDGIAALTLSSADGVDGRVRPATGPDRAVSRRRRGRAVASGT